MFIITSDKVLEYSIQDNLLTEKSTEIPPLKKVRSIFDPYRKQLGVYYSGRGPISFWNKEKNIWTPINNEQNSKQYYGHASFYDKNGNLYILGGIGNQIAKNHLQRYNFNTSRWDTLPVIGDYFQPRMHMVVCMGSDSSQVLIFGGVGNETGIQDEGFVRFLDFWSLDLNTLRMTMLWDIGSMDLDINPIDMIFDSKRRCVYILGELEEKLKSNKIGNYYQLYSASIDSAGLIPVGNRYESYSIINNSLFYSDHNQELITVSFSPEKTKKPENLTVNIYSLDFPPQQLTWVESVILSFNNLTNINFITIVTLIGIITAYYFYKRKTQPKTVAANQQNISVASKKRKEQGTVPRLQLFGDFNVFNNNGVNITQLFSPQCKEIFLLLLLNDNGIRINKLTSILWPDTSKKMVKNSRAVALFRLRKTLKEIDGATIIKYNHSLKLEIIKDQLYCDYLVFIKYRNICKNSDSALELNQITELLRIVNKGKFLSDLSFSWLDPIQTAITEHVVDLLKKQIDRIKNLNDNKLLLKLADAILVHDSLNEFIFKIKINTLYKLGDHSIAYTAYNQFSKEYEEIYDTPYGIKFNSLIL